MTSYGLEFGYRKTRYTTGMASTTGIPELGIPGFRNGKTEKEFPQDDKNEDDDKPTDAPGLPGYEKNNNNNLNVPAKDNKHSTGNSSISLPLNADTSDGSPEISIIKVPSPKNGIYVTVTFYNFLQTRVARVPTQIRELLNDVFKKPVWLVQLANESECRRENLRRLHSAFNIHLPQDQMDPADWIFWQRHADENKRMWYRTELSDEFPYFPLSIVPSAPGTMRFEIIISSKNGPVKPHRFEDVTRASSGGWSGIWHHLRRKKAQKIWEALVDEEYKFVDGVKSLKLASDQPHITAPDWSGHVGELNQMTRRHYQIPGARARF